MTTNAKDNEAIAALQERVSGLADLIVMQQAAIRLLGDLITSHQKMLEAAVPAEPKEQQRIYLPETVN